MSKLNDREREVEPACCCSKFVANKTLRSTSQFKEEDNPDFPEMLDQEKSEDTKNRWFMRFKKHWTSDYMLVVCCSLFFMYLQWIFIGEGSYSAFVFPVAPVMFVTFAVMMLEINGVTILEMLFKRKKKTINT